MHSPWGEIEVADAHIHFFSHAFFSALGVQKSAHAGRTGPVETAEGIAATLGWETPPLDAEALASLWIKELDRTGVRRAALIASIPGDESSVAAAVRAHADPFLRLLHGEPAGA